MRSGPSRTWMTIMNGPYCVAISAYMHETVSTASPFHTGKIFTTSCTGNWDSKKNHFLWSPSQFEETEFKSKPDCLPTPCFLAEDRRSLKATRAQMYQLVVSCVAILCKCNWRVGKISSGSRSKQKVYHGGEGLAAGPWGNCSHCSSSQEAEW